MTALHQLESYLKRLENRLRLQASAKGFAASAGCALVLTLALVFIANRYRFADGTVLPLRVLLFAALAAALTFTLALPVARINRRRLTRLAEARTTGLGGRLLTVVERPDPDNPFTDLLAEESLRMLRENTGDRLAPSRWLYGSLAGGVIAAVILLWMITAAPGYWGYGASLLWTGTARAASRPLYAINVQPGNKTVRRRSDQVISAQLLGFSSRNVVLHAKYHDAAKWESLPMQPQPEGNGYQLLFAGLADSLEYYIQADDIQSKHFTVGVKDLPSVKRVRVEIHYPSGLGLQDSVDDPGGDIRAVQGSQAHISVLTDKPLGNGTLVLENGSHVPLTPAANSWLTATLPINKDGSYHVAALDSGDTVRISDDYFIEAKKDEAPSVRIVRPGRDPHVSPIEEVPVTVEASDDFGVHSVQLHYSVNGGPEQVANLVQGKNAKEAQGKTTLYFEDLKLVPGDLVSFYAIAQDATHTSRSDIIFAQAEPFDFKFRQSQQAGGGGMGGGAEEQTRISERQKEIIAATWNELKTPNDRATVTENAHFLSDLESKLGDQAKALAARMGNRNLTESSPEFSQFSNEMQQASASMSSAVQQLKPGNWKDALPPEQKALQSLLHAEALFRDIQVAYGQRGGGGGMGAGGEERELARLFDLELDSSKNQYETGQSAAPQSQDQQKQIDEALARLKELARRQQELAEQPHTQQQQFQQRWEEEQLRREAEQLRQQMQQLSQNSQSQSQSGQQGQQSSSASASGSSSSSGSSSGRSQSNRGGMQSAQNRQSSQAMQQALDSLKRAEDEMRNAVSSRDRAAQSRAANQLAQAQQALRDMLQQQAGNHLSDLADRAHQLAQNQKDLASNIKKLYGADGINTAHAEPQAGGRNGDASPEMPEMDGPDYSGGWWRRQFMRESGGLATNKEKSLAGASADLSRQMQQLQQQLQHEAQSMAAEQPDAARKMRKALSDAEQEELALRMQKSSDWLRRGFGSQTWPMQDSISAGLDQLSRQLDQAQQDLQNGKGGKSGPADDKMLQALAQVRSLREQLEAQSRAHGSPSQQGGQQGQPGMQGDQQSQSQQSQSHGAQGEAQGGRTQSGQSQGGSAQSGNDTRNGQSTQWAPRGGGQPGVQNGAGTEETLNQLYALRSEFGRNDRQLNNSLNNAIESLRQIRSEPGRLDALVNQDAVTDLERLELELSRRIGATQTGARTGAPETAPEQYREALAQYFRQLSK